MVIVWWDKKGKKGMILQEWSKLRIDESPASEIGKHQGCNKKHTEYDLFIYPVKGQRLYRIVGIIKSGTDELDDKQYESEDKDVDIVIADTGFKGKDAAYYDPCILKGCCPKGYPEEIYKKEI